MPVTFTDSGTGGPAAAGQCYFCTAAPAPSPWPGSASCCRPASRPASSLRCIPASTAPPRPEQLASIASLAAVYAQLLRDLGLTDVCVIGNSIGGWIAAELALAESAAPDHRVSSRRARGRRRTAIDGGPDTGLLLTDPGPGIRSQLLRPGQVPDRPGDAASRAPGGAGGEQGSAARCTRAPRWETAACSAGCRPSHPDPGGLGRGRPHDPGPSTATLTPARSPGAQFRLITDAGHLPQLENPAELLAAVWQFASSHAGNANTGAGRATS